MTSEAPLHFFSLSLRFTSRLLVSLIEPYRDPRRRAPFGLHPPFCKTQTRGQQPHLERTGLPCNLRTHAVWPETSGNLLEYRCVPCSEENSARGVSIGCFGAWRQGVPQGNHVAGLHRRCHGPGLIKIFTSHTSSKSFSAKAQNANTASCRKGGSSDRFARTCNANGQCIQQ